MGDDSCLVKCCVCDLFVVVVVAGCLKFVDELGETQSRFFFLIKGCSSLTFFVK